MRTSTTMNMTEGKPLALLSVFALPLLIGNLFQQPFGSMSMALSTYAGQNMGAGKTQRIRAGYRDSLLAMMAVAGAMTLMMQLCSESLVSLFVHEPDVIAMGERALKITSKVLHDELDIVRNVQYCLERAEKEAEKNHAERKDQPFISWVLFF